jgi:Fur family ferric uptake transcriptional regulator
MSLITTETHHPGGPALHETISARLRLVDQRYTTGRQRLVTYLAACDHPVSIADIARDVPSLPRSTAYRNLVVLQEAGVVRRVAASDEFVRFELDEELTGHHHHLLCLVCGRVLDVDADDSFEAVVATTVARLAERYGFQARDHRLDILGRCAECVGAE